MEQYAPLILNASSRYFKRNIRTYGARGMGKQASPAVLSYLLTGKDADNLEKPEDP